MPVNLGFIRKDQDREIMNVYDDFFRGMTPEEWEFFAIDLLKSIGYTVLRFPSRGPDGGRDGLVSLNDKIYLVSCKHYIKSGKAVGANDEPSILDRIVQNQAHGFIGVYSTVLSTALDDRFARLTSSGSECIAYDGNKISNFLPNISSQVLQKYGLPNKVKYVLNVPDYVYSPLPCLGCGVDILDDRMITSSMALVCQNNEGKLEYLYGCRRCLGNFHDRGWVCLYQALHPEQFNDWISLVKDDIKNFPVSDTFYKRKNEFEGAIQQRMYPSNWGRWLAL
jgi:hypothetical protein